MYEMRSAETAALPVLPTQAHTLLTGLLDELGAQLTSQQLQQAIGQLDESKTGFITFGRFLLWWKG